MWKKSDDFSKEDLARLLASPQAQALARMLQQMDPGQLNQAAAMASQGNTEGAKQALSGVLQDPNVQQLIRDMEDNHGGI